MIDLLVSLAVGLLANAIWFAVELVVEYVRARENPPSDDEE